MHRVTFLPAAVVAPEAPRSRQSDADLVARPSLEPATSGYGVTPKPARKTGVRSRAVAARDTKLRKAPLAGESETRAV